jgi:hypothetical protein
MVSPKNELKLPPTYVIKRYEYLEHLLEYMTPTTWLRETIRKTKRYGLKKLTFRLTDLEESTLRAVAVLKDVLKQYEREYPIREIREEEERKVYEIIAKRKNQLVHSEAISYILNIDPGKAHDLAFRLVKKGVIAYISGGLFGLVKEGDGENV